MPAQKLAYEEYNGGIILMRNKATSKIIAIAIH